MDVALASRPARSSLHVAVAEALGREVLAGQHPVESLLPPEAELCLRFGVSRTVIREAVKLLASKGLLRTRSGIGTWVPPRAEWNFLDATVLDWLAGGADSAAMIGDLFAFRTAVEPAAAAAAATDGTDEDIAAIGRALAIMTTAETDLDRWIEGDVAFHAAIYEASNNLFMTSLANLFRKFFRASFRLSSAAFHHQHCLGEHRDVYEAIRARDPDTAFRAVQRLLHGAESDVRITLSR